MAQSSASMTSTSALAMSGGSDEDGSTDGLANGDSHILELGTNDEDGSTDNLANGHGHEHELGIDEDDGGPDVSNLKTVDLPNGVK